MSEMLVSPCTNRMDDGVVPMQSKAEARRTAGVCRRGLLCFAGLFVALGLVFSLGLLAPWWGGPAHAQEPTATATNPTETQTEVPTETPMPAEAVTATPPPTDTPTPSPTDTPPPTETATATETPVPTETATPTPSPQPTDTATSLPTETPLPQTATATPVAPTPSLDTVPKGWLPEYRPHRQPSAPLPELEKAAITLNISPLSSSGLLTTIAPWPMYLHDQHHSGYNSSETALQPPFSLAWSFDPDGQNNYIIGSPTVVGNVVYVGAYIDGKGAVYALAADTGEIIWQTPIDDPPAYSAPAMVNGILYICASPTYYPNYSGHLYALDANTGQVLWHKVFSRTMWCAPVVDGSLVYVITSDYYEQRLYAFDALTGEEVWSYTPPSHTSGNGNPLVINSKVVYYTGRQIVAVDAETGALAWETSFFNTNARLASWEWDLAGSEENGLIYATLYGSGAPSISALSMPIRGQWPGAMIWVGGQPLVPLL